MEEALEESDPKLKINEGHEEDGGDHEDEEEVCAMKEALEEPDLNLKIIKGHEEDGGGREYEDLCVTEEALEEPDSKLKIEGGPDEDGGGHEDEDVFGGGNDTQEDDDHSEEEEEDDHTEWDEDDELCRPSLRYLEPPVQHCTGASYTVEEARKIAEPVDERNYELLAHWCNLYNKNKKPSPLAPLIVLPKVTTACAAGYECYHLKYWTELTSATVPDHPYFTPCGMMQIFSLKLPSPLNQPLTIYGTFAVRDCWEPLRNHLFKRSRDDPATISPGCSSLPLCSPSRGIYVLQHILMDIDLWIKEEGDISADKPLFCGYIELDTSASGFETKLGGRLQGDYYALEMQFSFLSDCIETVVEVIAQADHPSDVKMSALTSGFDDEIKLYDDTFCGTGIMVKHVVAVKKLKQLHVLMKLDGSLYKWIFQAGVGVLKAPEHPISGFASYFVMNVSFRTRGKAASAWQWSCISNNVSLSVLPP